MKMIAIISTVIYLLIAMFSPGINMAADKVKQRKPKSPQGIPVAPPAPPAPAPSPLPELDDNDPNTQKNDANSSLKAYSFGYNTYNVLVPLDIEDYKYLFHNMPTGFLFANINPYKIRSMTVKDLKSGSFGDFDSYNVLKFQNIVGMEQIASEITSMDMFGVEENKNKIIDSLLRCQEMYKNEYDKYLSNRYRFNAFSGETNSKYFKIDKKYIVGYGYPYSYDFDKKILSMKFFNPESTYNSPFSWEKQYINKYDKKYNWNRKIVEFPETLKISLNVDDAKKIFQGDAEIITETIYDVSMSRGFIGSSGTITSLIQDMNIRRIIRKFYRGDINNSDSLVVIEIKSSRAKPMN